MRKTHYLIIPIVTCLLITGCASMIKSKTQQFASNIKHSMLNSDDVATVRQAMPAYIVILDSMVQGSPDDIGYLDAASTLYGSLATLATDDTQRLRLTQKSLNYAEHAACLIKPTTAQPCALQKMQFAEFKAWVNTFNKDNVGSLYKVGVAWAGWLQNRASDWNAVAELPRVRYIFEQVLKLDEQHDSGNAHLYLGVINSLIPANLGGKLEVAKKHFERAIVINQDKNLLAKVLYAKHYARMTFNQELHDKLLKQVQAANGQVKDLVLTNALAKEQANQLLASGEDYF